MMHSTVLKKVSFGRVNKFFWIPSAAVLVPTLATLGKLSWTASLLLGIPLAMISLFIPVGAGYICRFAPLGKAEMWRVGVTHFMRSEEHTSELQSRFGISYAVFCLKKKKT